MTHENLPGRLFQMGIVVPDMKAAIAYMQTTMGTGRFMTLPADPKVTWFRGNMEEVSYEMAFGYMGDMQIELMMPVSGRSTYAEYLERVPTGGVHHLGFEVTEFDPAVAEMEARGFQAVQKGSFGDTRFNYYEHPDDKGTLVEILYLDSAVKEMFATIADQSF
ncbi:VOC family protein [Salipiger abyssi]|uniref:VOC family protein n=1 Tax=Salipiger abyssi TaxID=1250539 RepID=UPI004059523F